MPRVVSGRVEESERTNTFSSPPHDPRLRGEGSRATSHRLPLGSRLRGNDEFIPSGRALAEAGLNGRELLYLCLFEEDMLTNHRIKLLQLELFSLSPWILLGDVIIPCICAADELYEYGVRLCHGSLSRARDRRGFDNSDLAEGVKRGTPAGLVLGEAGDSGFAARCGAGVISRIASL